MQYRNINEMAGKDIELFIALASRVYRQLQELEFQDRKNLRERLQHSHDQDKS